MSNLLVTGYTGTNHITSEDVASFNIGMGYSGDGILSGGAGSFNYSVDNANTITIASGDGMIQGHHVRIPKGETEQVTISNGIYGTKRVDYIVIRYTKNSETGIENAELHVIEGTQGDDYTDPELTKEDLFNGGTTRDLLLWVVYIDGVSIDHVLRGFDVFNSLKTVDTKAEESRVAIEYHSEHLRNLADLENVKIDSGEFTGFVSENDYYARKDITFTKTFSAAPSVQVTKKLDGSANPVQVGYIGVSKTGATLRIFAPSGNVAEFLNTTVSWLAIGK